MNLGRWAFLDVETTGMRVDYDRIIQISIIYQPVPEQNYSYLQILNPGNIIETNWWSGSVVSKERVRESTQNWRSIAKDVATIFRSVDYFVAHNATFDRNFIYQEMNRARVDFDDKPWFCTMRAAQNYLPGLPSYKLADVAKYLKLAWQGEAHDAEADTLMVKDIWFQLLAKFPQLSTNLSNYLQTIQNLPHARAW